MPVRVLPAKPNLEHLKHQAKDLLKQRAARMPEAAQLIREFHPRWGKSADAEIFEGTFQLADAQWTVARSHGFASWDRMKRHVEKPTLVDRLELPHHERIENGAFRRAVDLMDAGDVDGLRDFLREHPGLVKQQMLFEGMNYFRTPTLLEFVAENPVRRGTMPANVVAVTRVILEAGPTLEARQETLMLVATGSVAREFGVKGELIALLCAHGADPQQSMRLAAVLDEHDAVRMLISHGAKVDVVVAAAMGMVSEFERLVKTATADDRWLALAVAAQFGHTEIVRELLDAGEDPNRYNPPGGHAHSTPLHEAALAGHAGVVQLLVERGARIDLKDTMWGKTAVEWAEYGGKMDALRGVRGFYA